MHDDQKTSDYPPHDTAEREAILFRDWERAMTRINQAIQAGDRGECVPVLERCTGGYLWRPGYGWCEPFVRGAEDAIKAIIESHAADFELVRLYQVGILGGGREQCAAKESL